MNNHHRRSRRWKIVELELSQGIGPISVGPGYEGARALVRRCGQPVGWLSLPCDRETEITGARIREALARQLGEPLLPVLLEETRAAESIAGPPVPISVVVCTRHLTTELGRCLQALRALDYPDYEIIVVDNAPSDDATARLIADQTVRYVREDRPGLAWARNRGIGAARCPIIAFTDANACPDRGWLRAIAAAFAEPEVMAVTGIVAAAELETEAQVVFELGCGGMGRGFRRQVFRKEALGERALLQAGSFGVGTNMAFRRALFAQVGLFDVALDGGTSESGSGDVEMFHRLVAGGLTLVYEPAALVWQSHGREIASLRRQAYDNGRGFGAYLMACARNRTVRRRAILCFALRSWVGGWTGRRLGRPGRSPRRLLAAELAGALSGPWAYAAGQARARRAAAPFRECERVTTEGRDE